MLSEVKALRDGTDYTVRPRGFQVVRPCHHQHLPPGVEAEARHGCAMRQADVPTGKWRARTNTRTCTPRTHAHSSRRHTRTRATHEHWQRAQSGQMFGWEEDGRQAGEAAVQACPGGTRQLLLVLSLHYCLHCFASLCNVQGTAAHVSRCR